MNDKHLTTSAPGHEWDAHWSSLDTNRSLFGLLSVATRRLILQPAVAFYAKRFLPETGVFVEMGCGTAESGMERYGRKLIGLDFSSVALRAAESVGSMDELVQADIFTIPCRSQSIDGIWNSGVMEHFTKPQIRTCLLAYR